MVEVRVVGVDKVRHDISPEEWGRRLHNGFQAAGTLVEGKAKGIVKPHHFDGRFERGIHTNTVGSSLSTVKTTVGVSAAQVPEARPLTYGWKSKSGALPNIDAIARWVNIKMQGRTRSGSAKSGAKTIAFRIARSIRARGFTFGTGQGGQKLDTFSRAFDQSRDEIRNIIADYLAGRRTF